MTLDKQRQADGFYLLAEIFPLTNNNDKFKDISDEINIDIQTLAKNVINSIPVDGLRPENIEQYEKYLRVIKQIFSYMLGETDDYPALIQKQDSAGNIYLAV